MNRNGESLVSFGIPAVPRKLGFIWYPCSIPGKLGIFGISAVSQGNEVYMVPLQYPKEMRYIWYPCNSPGIWGILGIPALSWEGGMITIGIQYLQYPKKLGYFWYTCSITGK